MSHTAEVLDRLRGNIAPPDTTLEEARERRKTTLDAARAFKGVVRVYNAGSIAHGTANADTDADCGIVSIGVCGRSLVRMGRTRDLPRS